MQAKNSGRTTRQTSVRQCVALAVASFLFMAASSTALASDIWYVDASASSAGSGASWSDAFNDLQDALDNSSLSHGDQIWVAAGTYVPSKSFDDPHDPSLTFMMPDGVRVYGGFAGNEVERWQRNPEANRTVLEPASNSEYIVNAWDVGHNDIPTMGVWTGLDGFIIDCKNESAGLRSENAHIVVARCTIKNGWRGIHLGDGEARIYNCVFTNNIATYPAGGAYVAGKYAKFVNCLFHNNEALYGGGLFVESWGENSEIRLINCTVADNVSKHQVGPNEDGRGGGISIMAGTVHITNSIFWGNEDYHGGGEIAQIQIWNPVDGEVILSHTCVEGLTGSFGGSGNIGDDPQFGMPEAGNYQPVLGSPVIGAGRNAAYPANLYHVGDNLPHFDLEIPDLRLLPRFVGSTIDMGAYDYPYPSSTTGN